MIYLIITASLVDKTSYYSQDQRNDQYCSAIEKTLAILPKGIKPIIVENNGKRVTVLDKFNIDVHYTDNNNKNYFHKAVNEIKDIKSVIEAYNIQDDDYIIKITGRYYPTSDAFFRKVLQNHMRHEAFAKFYNVSKKEFMENDCVLGMYAIKSRHLKVFEYQNVDLSPEVQFSLFLNQYLHCLVCKIFRLHLKCCFAGNIQIVLDV